MSKKTYNAESRNLSFDFVDISVQDDIEARKINATYEGRFKKPGRGLVVQNLPTRRIRLFYEQHYEIIS